MTAEPLLALDGVSVAYGKRRALDGVSLTVGAGEIVTLLGANGSGKSTTLRAISGLVRPTAGRVVFDGRDITRAAPDAIVTAGVGHVPEGREIFPEFTVRENLLVEQNARRALALASRAYVLETGRVVVSGPAGALAADPRIRAAYLGLAEPAAS